MTRPTTARSNCRPLGSVLRHASAGATAELNDIVYGGVSLVDSSGTPDAFTRFSNDTTANYSPAWYSGDLLDGSPTSQAGTVYDLTRASANIPTGAVITPGDVNYGTEATDQAPVVTTTGSALSYTENAGAVAVDSGLTVTDSDSANLTGATVTISANYASGEDTLSFTNQNGITGSFSAGMLTLTGSASVANYQTALRSVTYANSSDNPSTATRTVSFVVNDGSTNSTAATRNITVTAVNDAPVVTVPGPSRSTKTRT